MTAFDVLAGLQDEVGPWAAHAEPLQLADAASILTAGPRRQFWTRTRAWSKTRDAGGILLAALLIGGVPPSQPAYCGASDADQAALVRQSIDGFVRGSGLRGRVTIKASTITDQETGGSIVILPADSAGSLGLRPSWAVLDEVCNWPTSSNAVSFFEALSSGVAKTGGRLLVISTAGLVGHWSEAAYRQALGDRAWRVSEVHHPPPWVPAEEISVERRRLPASTFLRYWANEWASGEDRLADAADVERCIGHSGPLTPAPGQVYIAAADLGVKSDPTVAVVMHAERRDEGSVFVVDRLQRWVPSKGRPVDLDDVGEFLVEMQRTYHPVRVLIESWQAFKMLGELRRRGLPVREFVPTAPMASRVALALFEQLRAGTLDLPDDEALVAELQSVRLLAVGSYAERYRLDHLSGKHNDQAVAIGIALVALLGRSGGSARTSSAAGVRVPPIQKSWTGRGTTGTRKVGRFTIPAAGYRPPEREGRW